MVPGKWCRGDDVIIIVIACCDSSRAYALNTYLYFKLIGFCKLAWYFTFFKSFHVFSVFLSVSRIVRSIYVDFCIFVFFSLTVFFYSEFYWIQNLLLILHSRLYLHLLQIHHKLQPVPEEASPECRQRHRSLTPSTFLTQIIAPRPLARLSLALIFTTTATFGSSRSSRSLHTAAKTSIGFFYLVQG